MTAAILLALAPVALLVALGYGLKHTSFIADTFWPQAERLCYYVLLPALFTHGLASAHLQALPVLPLAGTLIVATVVVALALVLTRPWMMPCPSATNSPSAWCHWPRASAS